jgi:hypothetical protein
MNTDAKITEKIIQSFTDRSIPVLSIHDSYIVPFGLETDLEDQLREAFEEVTRIPKVKLKVEPSHLPFLEPLEQEVPKRIDRRRA